MSPGHDKKETDVTGFKFSARHLSHYYRPVILSRMLLDQLKAIFLGEKHEPVHGPLRLVRVLARLLGRRHRGRHHRARGGGGPHRGQEARYPVSQLEARVRAAGAGWELVRQVLAGKGKQTELRRGVNTAAFLQSIFSPWEFKFLEPVTKVRGPDGLWVIGRETHVCGADVLTRDPVLLQRQPRVGGAPAWKQTVFSCKMRNYM